MTRALLAALAALVLGALGACTPRNYVVLLDNPDGHQSTVTLTTGAGSGVIDKPGAAIGADSAKDAPKSVDLDKKDIDQTFGRAIGSAAPAPVVFVLHFKFDTTELTDESKRDLPKVLDTLKQRPAPDISVVGHTDRAGTTRFNYELGLRRAQEVRKQIVAIGVDPKLIEVSSHGEFNPVVPTRPGQAEPRNRRVEVTVR
jgi:outer membrane protein OmpA-like peptidoglycan-associated protein